MKWRLIFICFFTINPLATLISQAQTDIYRQFVNEFDFNEDLANRWALEVNLGQNWTSRANTGSLFTKLSQLYGTASIHFALNARWKLSYWYGYYLNEDVPEIDQQSAPEWRSTMEAIYYIHRQRSVISTRLRLEDRHIKNDSVFEAVDRLRWQIKATYPINRSVIEKKTVYAIASEEVMFKSGAKISGESFFDRNMLTLGFGYGINDNFQIEVTYINEYLPRKGVNNSYNEVQFTLIFNNVFKKMNGLFRKKEPNAPPVNQ